MIEISCFWYFEAKEKIFLVIKVLIYMGMVKYINLVTKNWDFLDMGRKSLNTYNKFKMSDCCYWV